MKAVLVILLFVNLLFPSKLYAQGINCPDRYATIINPVRSRFLWTDSNLKHVNDQYKLIKDRNLAATWLLQSDVLEDKELLIKIQDFDKSQEIGIFLEVSKNLAQKARVIYPDFTPWYFPNAVFLSGYTPSERIKLIDRVFGDFNNKFGYFPKSIGAWWIDSYSLNYLKEKYKISSVLIVADQKTTDNYGVWGQWWGIPYYPGKANILIPARGESNKLDLVVLQWAQRHPTLAFGEGFRSAYSLQANDYLKLYKNFSFFEDLSKVYLDCNLPIGQITVGLETGMESVGFLEEYGRQLDFIKEKNLKVVTMSGFTDKFSAKLKANPEKLTVGSVWELTPEYRFNKEHAEKIDYFQEISFSDYFVRDNANFLNRKLALKNSPTNFDSRYAVIVLILILGLISFFKKALGYWLFYLAFCLSAFGTTLISFYRYGWVVFYGPVINGLIFWQVFLIFGVFSGVYFSRKRVNLNKLWILILPFGLDPVIKAMRFSYISNEYYLGFAFDQLRFIGIKFLKTISFVNTDLPPYQSVALLRINFDQIFWSNDLRAFVLFPVIHLALGAVLLYILPYLPRVFRKLLILILASGFVYNIFLLLSSDPKSVLPF